MTKQITDTLVMVRPVAFKMNAQTAVNNYYQRTTSDSDQEVQRKALNQFDEFVNKLRGLGMEVIVFEDSNSATPDSIFPNNWVSFHEEGTLCLYPMFAENRRWERREDILEALSHQFVFNQRIDFTTWEQKSAYLEGTGSLLLDRVNKIVYAALSFRTMKDPLNDFCEKLGYKAVTFHALQSVDGQRLPIYHTNVMMCLGEKFAVVCLASIDDTKEREQLIQSLIATDKDIIEISEHQKEQFAGNMLQVRSQTGKSLVVMSSAAYQSLSEEQIKRLAVHGELVHSDISIIELLGGGSARCMMAEVFYPEKEA